MISTEFVKVRKSCLVSPHDASHQVGTTDQIEEGANFVGLSISGLVEVKLKIASHLHRIGHHYSQISISIPKSACAITSSTVTLSPFNNTAGVFSPAGASKTNFSGRVDVDFAGARVGVLTPEEGAGEVPREETRSA